MALGNSLQGRGMNQKNLSPIQNPRIQNLKLTLKTQL